MQSGAKIQRFTLKNIVLHLRKILPTPLFMAIVWFRFLFFKTSCKNKENSVINYTDGNWIYRKVTLDQRNIMNYLDTVNLAGKQLLHIGIGNSSIAKRFSLKLEFIDGITIVKAEKEYADHLNLTNYTTFLINKYSEELKKLNKRYDYIIDNDLAGYACCKYHFLCMFETYLNLLNKK